jgi:nicotinamide-nucleotide amidase
LNGEVISIGHELLMGEIVDTNSSFFAQRLAETGVTVRWFSSVGDDLSHICEAIERALSRSDVIVTSGGLGPTSDDLTREAVARVLHEEMRVDAGLLAWLEGVFRQRGIAMPSTNIKQATLIPSATSVPNPTGTAPGWWVTSRGRHIILTPGPPREITRMWEETIGPRLAQITGTGVVYTRTLKTYGMTEGGIDEVLADLFGKENPYLGIYARPDGIHLRIIAKAPTRPEAARLAEPVEREIAARLGTAIWGTDAETPASRVIALLSAQGRTLAMADSATGGNTAALLAATEGHGKVFKGALVTGPESGSLGAVLAAASAAARVVQALDGEHQALALADAAREGLGADVGLSVTRTPDGGVYFGAVSDKGSHSGGETRRWPRDIAMNRAAVMALIGLAGAVSRGEV